MPDARLLKTPLNSRQILSKEWGVTHSAKKNPASFVMVPSPPFFSFLSVRGADASRSGHSGQFHGLCREPKALVCTHSFLGLSRREVDGETFGGVEGSGKGLGGRQRHIT